jgi:hypothetical protein
MDRDIIRLECLKLANSAAPMGPAEVIGRAKMYEKYVVETEDIPTAPPAPKEKVPEPETVKADKKQAKKTENPLS